MTKKDAALLEQIYALADQLDKPGKNHLASMMFQAGEVLEDDDFDLLDKEWEELRK